MIPKHTSAAPEHGKNRLRLLTLRAELRCSEQQFAWRISFVRIYSPERCEREPGMIHNLRLSSSIHTRDVFGVNSSLDTTPFPSMTVIRQFAGSFFRD
jgi:hypothetical protein